MNIKIVSRQSVSFLSNDRWSALKQAIKQMGSNNAITVKVTPGTTVYSTIHSFSRDMGLQCKIKNRTAFLWKGKAPGLEDDVKNSKAKEDKPISGYRRTKIKWSRKENKSVSHDWITFITKRMTRKELRSLYQGRSIHAIHCKYDSLFLKSHAKSEQNDNEKKEEAVAY